MQQWGKSNITLIHPKGVGGAAITGQMGAASSVVHDMFTAAVFERL